MKCRKLDSKNNIVWFGKSWDSTDFKYWINIPSIGEADTYSANDVVEGEDVVINGLIYPSQNITINGTTYILVFDKDSTINGKVYKARPEEVPAEHVRQVRSMRAADPTPSVGLTFVSNGDGTCYVESIGTCTDTDIVIPSTSPDEDTVTSIGYAAFYNCHDVTSVTIPDSVTSIGDYVFEYCSGLKSITIPNSVTSIGTGAFYGCSGLTSIIIPDNVMSIGGSAVRGCSNLLSITIPFVGATKDGTGQTYFGYIFGASSYTYNSSHVPSSLKTVIITGGTSIGNHAFFRCSGLTSVTIPDSVTSIGNRAFEYCSNLTTVVIGSGLTAINEYVFHHCISLNSITIGENVTTIGNRAFWHCDSLIEITIPNSVTTIDQYAFFQCNNLKTVIMSTTIKTIGLRAFSGCRSLSSIYYDNSPAAWDAVVKGIAWDSGAGNYTIYYQSSPIDQVGVFTKTTGTIPTSYSVDTEAVADSLTQRLSVIKGELWYQINYGLPLTDSYTSLAIFDMIIADIITSHPAVAALESFTSQKTGHIYSFNGNIRTIFGDQISISNSYSM